MIDKLWLVLLLANPGGRPPPMIPPQGPLASGWTLDGLEDKCSVEGLVFDSQCLKSILMDLGAEPVVETRRLPNGGFTETVKQLKPDYARAEALMQQACGYRHWESCMQYVALLEEGKHYPNGKERAIALLQWACSERFARACESLREDHIPFVPSAKSPILAWTANERGPAKLPARIKQPDDPVIAAAPKPPENDGAAKVRALLQAKCDQGDVGSCNALPKSPPSQTEGTAPDAAANSVNANDLRKLCNEMVVASACYGLAKAIEDGRVKPRSPVEARMARQNACTGGVKEACGH